MKWNSFLLIVATAFCLDAEAKDFGTFGHTFEIEEPDLLKSIQSKLQHLEGSGMIQHHQDEIVNKTKHTLANPAEVVGITRAKQDRTFRYDPAILVPYDLKDHEGRVFQKAGTRVNPMSTLSLSSKLVFIQGDDKAQVKWVEETFFNHDIKVKVVLVSGSPFELMEVWGKPVYFDQGGVITTKLGIGSAPAIVEQEDRQLKISEIYLKDLS